MSSPPAPEKSPTAAGRPRPQPSQGLLVGARLVVKSARNAGSPPGRHTAKRKRASDPEEVEGLLRVGAALPSGYLAAQLAGYLLLARHAEG